MTGHQPKPEECDSCNWATEDLTEVDAYARTRGHGPFTPDDEKQWAWLCEVCRSTLIGNAFLYPRQYENQPLMSSVAWCTNRILAEIRKDAATVQEQLVELQRDSHPPKPVASIEAWEELNDRVSDLERKAAGL